MLVGLADWHGSAISTHPSAMALPWNLEAEQESGVSGPRAERPSRGELNGADGRASLTVRQALALPCLAVGAPELLAGKAAVNRAIRWAHVGEVENLASLLRGGELVLTTGVGLPGNDRGLARFVAELAERGVAALVVELGARFMTVPEALISAADGCVVPLIALHREVSFVEITEAINDHLHRLEVAKARVAERVQHALTSVLIEGGGVQELLAALVREVGNPVVLEHDNGELLAHAVGSAESGPALAAWDAVSRGLPGAPPSLTLSIPAGRTGISGRLVVVATEGPLGPSTEPSLQRAADLIAIATRQSRQEQAVAARARGDVLMSLIDSELPEADIQRQAVIMGFPPRFAQLLPCVFTGPMLPYSTAPDDTIWATIWGEVRRELEGQAIPVLGGLSGREGEVCLVVGLASSEQRTARADLLVRLFSTAVKRSFGAGDPGTLVVGAAARSWTSVLSGFHDVLDAARLRRGPTRGWYDASRPSLDRLLWSLRESKALRLFVEARLAPLDDHDARREPKLLPTLEAYLRSGGQKAETGRMLHLERQSVHHRINRIEELLDSSLDDENTRLGVHLALRLRHLLGNPNRRVF
jgi:purine catabolism regulator